MSEQVRHSALLIMHCQNDIVDKNGLYNKSGAYLEVKRRDVINKIRNLHINAHEAEMPVFFINNAFSEGYPELRGNNLPICDEAIKSHSFLEGTWGSKNPIVINPSDGDIVIRNYNTSAFSYTNLDQILRAKRIEKLYLTGVATNFVVESTARYGAELGYEINIIEDCCASWTEDMHKFAIDYTLPQFARIVNSEFVLNSLLNK